MHVWASDPAYPFAAGAQVPPAVDASAERLIRMMDAHGIARTVLIQVIHYRWDNRYLADVLKRYPGRFHGVARVNPADPAAPDHVDALTEQGFRGVRISPFASAESDWIGGPLMAPLWARYEALKVPMTVLTVPGRLLQIAALIDRHPDLAVVIDHMADTPPERADQIRDLLALARFPNVFVKISHLWSLSKQAFPYADAFALLKQVYDAFGPKRLMWGTDHPVCLPHLSYARAIALYRDHLDFMPLEDRQEIWHRTVQRIWPFGL
ncbi:amidohydrolase family protein [Burkholderia gladioli]|uniref:amidohydrolase family protein n=1 Tax=Burkholderia gladioli TaxID=28095 RepID=UPI001ABAFD11|nr:amidohydrolase family protein [Burkholderia gladioli]MBU9180058.1 amidohydrolase family protein [Burkholderia gladioli]